MANIYVRSTDGADADNGSTWALAKASLAGASAIDAAGDTVFVSQVHNESSASTQTCSWAGTRASPVRVLCGNDGAEPPTALATTGKMTTTGLSNIVWNGFTYTYGVIFQPGSGNNATLFSACNTNGDWQIFEQCSFLFVTTQGATGFSTATGTNCKCTLINCTFRFGSVANGISVNGNFHINGGSVLSGGTNITTFLRGYNANGVVALVENFDLSNLSTTLVLSAAPATSAIVTFRNCKLPASWAGSLSAAMASAGRVSMYNCDSGNTNYRLWIEDYCGNIKSETTRVKSGGATDGSTHISWKMVSSTAASYAVQPLYSDPIAVWTTAGSGSPTGSKTATVEILHDSATNLKDDEVWLEVGYLGTAGSYVGSIATDAKASPVATAVDQDASSVTWTTTGLANPNKQKLVVSFTPEREGFIYCRVALAKASKTIYVDPIATVA